MTFDKTTLLIPLHYRRESDAVSQLVRSAAMAGTAAELLGVGTAGRSPRLRLYQDSLFVKRPVRYIYIYV